MNMYYYAPAFPAAHKKPRLICLRRFMRYRVLTFGVSGGQLMSAPTSKSKLSSKIIALVLSLMMILTAMPLSFIASADNGSGVLTLPSISDVHYVADFNRGNYNDSYMSWAHANNKHAKQMDSLLDSALAAVEEHAKKNGMKYLLLAGDLSANGELANHEALAKRLEQFEKDTGIQVIVTNGNHDINNSDASTFMNGKEETTMKTTPELFKQTYKNLGWDIAYHTFRPSTGKAGMLSYSVKLDGGYRLIVMDAGKYSKDNTENKKDEHETGGNITDELMNWILAECADAKASGETVIGMTHWDLSPQSYFQGYVLQGFVMDNWEQVSDKLADAGMHWVFTGHSHCSDISSTYSDGGEAIYSIMTCSLVEFPHTFRETTFTKSGNSVKADFNVYDADCVKPITDSDGKTYAVPYRESASLNNQYYDLDLAQYITNIIMRLINEKVVPGIKEDGSLIDYIQKSFNLDLQSKLNDLIGGGITIAGIAVFNGKNIMNLVKDISSQLEKNYLKDTTKLRDIIYNAITALLNEPISEETSNKFASKYGFGSGNKAGTLGDAAKNVLVYMYEGNEDISDDAFMLDVLAQCDDGSLTDKLIDMILKDLLHGVIMDELLSNIEINLETVLGLDKSSTLGGYFDYAISGILGLLGSDKSAMGIINMLLKKGIVKQYGYSVDEIIENLRSTYIDPPRKRSIGWSLKNIIGSMVTDDVPQANGDNNVSYTYSGPVAVLATSENMRKPSEVTVTFGTDAKTTANINWYTKYSVKGTDIEIYAKGKSEPVFSGKNYVDDGIDAQKITAETTRTFPGVDVGVFGIFDHALTTQRHTVKLSGLKAGATYYYRVGDASLGWWSETGTISTADGSDTVTFIHTADPQASSPDEYQDWYSTLELASRAADYDFILNTGDIVDHGNNLKQWQWALDGKASETIMNTFFAPASGNHEGYGQNATVTNFYIDNAPEQDTTTGVYYSFDYNNIHVAVLNTNDLNDKDALTDTQIDWLKKDMNSSSAQWKFVSIHKGVYTNGTHYHDDDVTAIRGQLKTLMPELKIDIVFQGHDHVYLRTNALNNNEIASSGYTGTSIYNDEAYKTMEDPTGTVYVISGTAGSKHYPDLGDGESGKEFPTAEKIYKTEKSMFSKITVDGDTLYFDAYTSDGTAVKNVDSFAIKKSQPQYLKGDVNLDGKVTAEDARLALRHSAKLENLTGLSFKAGDLNADGNITAGEARTILRVAAKLEKF